jgi:capsular exopolysaccharide synthesis family protein
MSHIYQAVEEAERVWREQRQRSDVFMSRNRPEDDVAPWLEDVLPEGDQIVREYEKLLAALRSLPASRRSRALMICSATSGEGASTVAAQLALTCARQDDTKTLLVDANLRHPDVHRRFGIPRVPGWTNALSEGGDVTHCTRQGLDGLHLLTIGNARLRSERIFDSERFSPLLSRLEEAYDNVILDSAPVNISSEALALAQQVGAVVLVVLAERTRIDVIAAARDKLVSRDAYICGVVLNQRRFHIPQFLYRRL